MGGPSGPPISKKLTDYQRAVTSTSGGKKTASMTLLKPLLASIFSHSATEVSTASVVGGSVSSVGASLPQPANRATTTTKGAIKRRITISFELVVVNFTQRVEILRNPVTDNLVTYVT